MYVPELLLMGSPGHNHAKVFFSIAQRSMDEVIALIEKISRAILLIGKNLLL